jgi:hypothetical protein
MSGRTPRTCRRSGRTLSTRRSTVGCSTNKCPDGVRALKFAHQPQPQTQTQPQTQPQQHNNNNNNNNNNNDNDNDNNNNNSNNTNNNNTTTGGSFTVQVFRGCEIDLPDRTGFFSKLQLTHIVKLLGGNLGRISRRSYLACCSLACLSPVSLFPASL